MCNTPFRVYQNSFGIHTISVEMWRSITQPYHKLVGKQYPRWGNLQTQWVQLF
jgi:hypothetical protein